MDHRLMLATLSSTQFVISAAAGYFVSKSLQNQRGERLKAGAKLFAVLSIILMMCVGWLSDPFTAVYVGCVGLTAGGMIHMFSDLYRKALKEVEQK